MLLSQEASENKKRKSFSFYYSLQCLVAMYEHLSWKTDTSHVQIKIRKSCYGPF